MDFDNAMLRSKIERNEEWDKWSKEIPFINFDKEWSIKIIPPFAGAIARFVVKDGENIISVYLDCYDNLGCFGSPYWEMYPRTYEDYEDVYRTGMKDVDDLIENIRDQFTKMK